MEVSSSPDYPSARQQVGDYAVRQQSSNQSNATLNSMMESTFKPAHVTWTGCWSRQQQAETALSDAIRDRDTADKNLDASIEGILQGIRYTQKDNHSPLLKKYVPGGNLLEAKLPLAEQASRLESYAQLIADAPDSEIPAADRARFAEALEEARAALAKAEAALAAVNQARKEREAQDPLWDTAYDEYHREVEHQMKGDRTLIKTWIKQWP